MNEQKLIRDCIKQKPKAQRMLFDMHYLRLYKIAFRYIADHHEAEDILLVAFNKIFKYIERFEYRHDGSFNSWLNTIVINEALRLIKSRSKNIVSSSDSTEIYASSTLSIRTNDIDTEHIYQIISNMPDGYRTVFNLVAIEGYSHKEVAQKLDITESTSRTQLNKARKHIIEKLKAENYGAA